MRLPLAFACLLAGSCSSGPLGPDLQIKVANKLDGSGNCQADTALTALGASSLRLTVRVHRVDPMTHVDTVDSICDASFQMLMPTPTLEFKLPDGDSVDVYAEAFDASNNRIATGSVFGVNPKDTTAAAQLRLFATESFRCLPGSKLNQPRAFHTATRLPNGEILIVGGIVPKLDNSIGPTATGTQSYITGTVEAFDTRTGIFMAVTEATSPPPLKTTLRAFHDAILLPGGPPYQVLLLGGLSVDPSKQSNEKTLAVGDNMVGNFTQRIAPTGSVVQTIGAEILTYDPSAHTVTRAAAPSLHSLPYQGAAPLIDPNTGAPPALGGGFVAVGGFDWKAGVVMPPMMGMPPQFVDSTGNGMGAKSAMLDPTDVRYGASLVAISDTRALVVGGVPDAMPMMGMPTQPFDQLAMLTGTPVVTPVGASGGSFPFVQAATLTLLGPLTKNGPATVLVSGGLELGFLGNNQDAVNPPKDNGGLYKLSVPSAVGPVTVATVVPAGGYKYDNTCTQPGRYKPVAYNAATLITAPTAPGMPPAPDRVLVTGGMARFQAGVCNDCDNNDPALACLAAQTAVYDVAGNKIAPAPDNIQIARYGHTQTVMPDGKVVIIGGYTRNNKQTYAVQVPEVWNPVRHTPPPTDTDDPIFLDLAAAKMKRDPGAQGYCASDGGKASAMACGTPGRPLPMNACM